MTPRTLVLTLSFSLSLALAAIAPTPAFADDDTNAAREHYHRGTKLFDLRRYHEAAKEFEAAYEAKDDPALLYNIAQAYRLGGETSEAVGAYQSYLRRNPMASNRDHVEEEIASLKSLLKQQQHSQHSEPADVMAPHDVGTQARPGERPSATGSKRVEAQRRPPARADATERRATPSSGQGETPGQTPGQTTAAVSAEPATVTPIVVAPTPDADGPSPGRSQEIAGAVILVAGVALAGMGGYFGSQASAAGDQLSHPSRGQVFDPALESTGQTDQVLAYAFIVGGAVAAVVGAVVFTLGWRAAHRSPSTPSALFVPSLRPGEPAVASALWRW